MVHLIILLTYNILRIGCMKVAHWSHCHIHIMQRISPFCALKIFGHGNMLIGRNTELAHGCDIEVHGQGVLNIGEGTYMNRYCMISAHEHVSIGKHCMFGPGVKIFDNNHKFNKKNGVLSELSTAPILIGDHCWIASDVIILKGAHIGNNCVIGAGCVITGEVPDCTIVKNKSSLEITPIHS